MSSDSPGVPRTNTTNDRTGPADLDAVMELLSDRRRRYVLYCLRNDDGSLAFEELAGRILDWEEHTPVDSERRILTELRHKHLPKMEAVGVIEREEDQIRFDGSDVPIEPYLELAVELDPAVGV